MSRVSYPSPYIITKDTIGSDLRWEDVSSQIDGVTASFTLSEPADEEKIFVYYNGLIVNPDIIARSETSFRGKSNLSVGNTNPVRKGKAARPQKPVTWY